MVEAHPLGVGAQASACAKNKALTAWAFSPGEHQAEYTGVKNGLASIKKILKRLK